ncbi:DUF1236 domain-containing protein [Roseovarius sp. S1116L3]|uniref:DUF1236 domain-containing protein n=1 Tax=Roseovarius roseus TaxID=3342636 RepID=UPI00372A9C63
MRKLAFGISTAAILVGTAASAELVATSFTDLNLRAGPGPQYEVVGVISASDEVDVVGCLDANNWCEVSYNGTTGWAYGDYLSAPLEGEPVVVYENRKVLEVKTVNNDKEIAKNATGAATFGGIAGALIGGPVGAAVGVAAGGAAGTVATPPESVTTYVVSNEVEPVYLDGEVVVGSGLPETVEISKIPDSEFGYVYVNGVRAVVDPADRRVVHIVR